MRETTIEQRQFRTHVWSVVLMIAISLSITLYYSIYEQQRQIDYNISNVAVALADLPMVKQVLKGDQAAGDLKEYLDRVRESMNQLDVITVCDTEGIRYYHTDPEKIGHSFIGGDEGEILQGAAPYISVATGTLGTQRRAFHGVQDENGQLLGFVMVSVFTESIWAMRNQILLVYCVLTVLLIGAGSLLARWNMENLRMVLMGYQPEEFVTKFVERSEVLDVLEEGLFAVDPEGRVILMNQSARDMLGIEPERRVEGEALLELYPETKLLEVLESGKPQYNQTMVLNGNHILTSRIPLLEQGRTAGAISIFRNKTEVINLAEQLTGAQYMLDTLRAFNHEFMNKLHVILGYLQLGKTSEAMEYINNTTLVSSQSVKEVSRQIGVQHLAALIIGKMMRASELGIHLKLKSGSHCSPDTLLLPMDCYTTILGNLMENALDELNLHGTGVKVIEIGIYCDPGCSILTCEDTGGGIPEEIRSRMFMRGVSTKGEGRGTGMYLIREITDEYHGEIQVETEAGEGTCITISFTEPSAVLQRQASATEEERECTES